MPTRDRVVSLVEGYVAALDVQDVEAVVALFAEDATHEDPVGEGADVGHDAIRAYFTQTLSVPFDARLDGPVTVHGRFAAFRARIEVAAGRTPFVLLVGHLAEVAPDGRFRTLTAVPDSRAAALVDGGDHLVPGL